MRRFFLPALVEPGKRVRITGQDARHIKQVLRLNSGDIIEIAGDAGQIAIARLERIEAEQIIAYVESVVTGGAEPPVTLILAQGLPKADKMDFIVQKAVELGVAAIQPLDCDRSVVRYDNKKAASRVERWQNIAHEAAKQAKRDAVPEVLSVRSLKELFAARQKDTAVILLYEDEKQHSLRGFLKGCAFTRCLLLVGPEGGFSREEYLLCIEQGAASVTLGPRILRTETASLAALSIIQYERGDLGGCHAASSVYYTRLQSQSI